MWLRRSRTSKSEATALTDCNREPLTFSSLGPKSVIADFLGGRLTANAGALLLREVGPRTGLFDAINEVIADPSNASRLDKAADISDNCR